MGRLIDDPELAARLGEAGHARVAEEFTLAKMADGYVTLFQSLIRSVDKVEKPAHCVGGISRTQSGGFSP